MRTTLRLLIFAAVVAGAASTGACNKDSPTEIDVPGDPNESVSGSFALTSIDQKSLPFKVLADTGYSIEVTAGSALLDTNHTFIMPLTTRENVAGFLSTYVDTIQGSWTQDAGVVTLTPAGAFPATATWDGRRLTAMWSIGPSVNTYVYTRR
jgi:hypothetical protein